MSPPLVGFGEARGSGADDGAGRLGVQVAAAFEVAPSQLSAWRRQMSDGELDEVATPAFARVEVVPEPAEPVHASKLVIDFPSGVRMRVDSMVDINAVLQIIGALKRKR
ncbi:hypothetical protein SAMN05428974_1321 [Sphingopyxis sp. YR583]|nr:hypothetical protein SAMN05428974_1321 [Sphingopyxis sp. YR583]